jgi:trehalose 6-phosphate synthase
VVSRATDRAAIAGYMRLARVGLVTPLRDGMNLVAKEYVAAQDPEDPGVLVLSQFAGAARQLGEALLVNPHDQDQVADALDQALRMPLVERKSRWQALWAEIADRSPTMWGRSFVAALMRTAQAGAKPARRVAAFETREQVVTATMPAQGQPRLSIVPGGMDVAKPVDPRRLN